MLSPISIYEIHNGIVTNTFRYDNKHREVMSEYRSAAEVVRFNYVYDDYDNIIKVVITNDGKPWSFESISYEYYN